MKKYSILAIVLLPLLVATSFGQDFDDMKARSGFTVGPGLHAGGSMILDSPEGFKVKPLFGFKAEVNGTYPVSPNIGVALALGFDSRGSRTHIHNNKGLYTDTKIGYLSFYPQLILSSFSIGLNLGIPMTGTQDGTLVIGDVDVKDEATTMIEPRLGAVIPVETIDDGWFSIVVGAGFCVNELIEAPSQVNAAGDWRSFSAHLGVRYEFLIPDTERE